MVLSKTKDIPGDSSKDIGFQLRLRFITCHSEKTGQLSVFNLRLTLAKFNPQPGLLPQTLVTNQNGRWEYFIPVRTSNVKTWQSGFLVHVLFRIDSIQNSFNFAMGFSDRDKAEIAFREAEEGMWESVESRRKCRPGIEFGIFKDNKWHCDLLECVRTEQGGWKRPIKGDTLWLRSVIIL